MSDGSSYIESDFGFEAKERRARRRGTRTVGVSQPAATDQRPKAPAATAEQPDGAVDQQRIDIGQRGCPQSVRTLRLMQRHCCPAVALHGGRPKPSMVPACASAPAIARPAGRARHRAVCAGASAKAPPSWRATGSSARPRSWARCRWRKAERVTQQGRRAGRTRPTNDFALRAPGCADRPAARPTACALPTTGHKRHCCGTPRNSRQRDAEHGKAQRAGIRQISPWALRHATTPSPPPPASA